MKLMTLTLIAVLLLQTVAVPCANAQEVTDGARVRIKAPSFSSERIEGTITKVGADTLSLRSRGAVLDILRGSILSMQVRRGYKSRALLGSVLGLFAGTYSCMGIIVAAGGTLDSEKQTFGEAIYQSCLISLSAAVGTFIGYKFGKRFRRGKWKKVSTENLRLGYLPNGHGLMLALSTRF